MRRFMVAFIATLLLFGGLAYGRQRSGIPSNLFISLDSSGYVNATATGAGSGATTTCLFTNCVMKLDSNGYLGINCQSGCGGGGTAPGASKDILANISGSIAAAETGIFTYDPVAHVLQLGSGGLGDGTNYRIKWDGVNSSVAVRNAADSAYVKLEPGDLTVHGNPSFNNNPIISVSAGAVGMTWFNGSFDTGLFRNTGGVLEVNNGTACSTQSNCRDLQVRNVLSTNGTAILTVASAQATNQTVTWPALREAETVAIKPQNSLTSASAPAGTTTTASFVMLGLGANITPQVTGRVMVTITGMAINSTIADGCNAKVAWGTGTNPVNAAAATGTVIGSTKSFVASTAAGKQGIAFNALLTGATINTQIWVDLQFQAVTGGTCTLSSLDVTLFEF